MMAKEPSLENICLSARREIAKAVDFIREESVRFNRSRIEKKGFNDLVSYVDRTSEQMLVDGLKGLISDCGFITEEETAGHKNQRYKWIIDPLDGTTNFTHGVPCYAVSVALMDGDELVIGIVHEVNLDECFWSYKGSAAYCNDNMIRVSSCEHMNDALIVTGFPYTDYSRMESYMKVFDYCMRNTQGLRRPGSAAVDLAYVAAGRFEAFYEYGLNPWDIAAGAFLVQQAGGVVTDFSGGRDFIFGREIIASNKLFHDPFQNMVSGFMNI